MSLDTESRPMKLDHSCSAVVMTVRGTRRSMLAWWNTARLKDVNVCELNERGEWEYRFTVSIEAPGGRSSGSVKRFIERNWDAGLFLKNQFVDDPYSYEPETRAVI